ncbi:hypothetical protein BJ944DRAFT_261691 [Cunninghamella echinulata]|nr:hypothetical protein BJ944DRAFT_261691 [Cunninghamella echinulata]
MTSPYSELQQTLKANASTNSLPRPDISSERRSSLSGLEVPRKGLTLQRSQPSLSSSFKSSKKKTKSQSIETQSDFVLDNTSSLTTVDTSKSSRLASEKRNKEFHTLFKSIPEEDHLIEDYGCALQKDILLQGRIYISQRYVCFNSNIFGWVTNLVIAFSDIVEIEKKTTAIFIPNAIQISTHQSKHFFASFLSREQAYEQMMEIWKSPLRSTMSMNSTTKDINDSFDDQSLLSDDSLSLSQWDEKDDRDFNGKKPYQHDLLSSSNEQWHDERQSSLASLPIPKQQSHEENEAARRRAISEAGPRPSTESLTLMQNASEVPLPNQNHFNQISTPHTHPHPHDNNNSNSHDKTAINNQSDVKSDSNGLPSISKQSQTSHQSKPTTDCQCVKNAEDHYPNVVMDQTYHCSMETLYNLLYQSDFVKKFLIDIEKNTDVVIGTWCKGDNVPFSREMSYTKYLGGSIGPKTTKCLLKEELTHLDLKNSITQQITCHTPDVPSGNSFCVKTRVCISWAGQGCVRMLVTVQVPFSRSSWLKSTIEKASIFGQVNYYKRLDTAIRQYTESKSHGSSTSSRTKKHRHKRKTQSRLSNNYNTNGKDTNNNNNSNSNNNQSSNKNGILGMLSSASSDIIQMISDLGPSSISIAQCTMVCLVLMVMINLYIALKMAYMGDQLYTLHSHNDQSSSSSSSSPSSFFSTFYQPHGKKSSSSSPLDIWRDQHHDDVDSMWHWLNQLDHSQKQYNNNDNKKNKNDQHPNMNSNYILTEHFKHQGKVSPEFLKQHIMELEKMVYRTENSIDQVHKAVRKQRQNLLQNLAS